MECPPLVEIVKDKWPADVNRPGTRTAGATTSRSTIGPVCKRRGRCIILHIMVLEALMADLWRLHEHQETLMAAMTTKNIGFQDGILDRPNEALETSETALCNFFCQPQRTNMRPFQSRHRPGDAQSLLQLRAFLSSPSGHERLRMNPRLVIPMDQGHPPFTQYLFSMTRP